MPRFLFISYALRAYIPLVGYDYLPFDTYITLPLASLSHSPDLIHPLATHVRKFIKDWLTFVQPLSNFEKIINFHDYIILGPGKYLSTVSKKHITRPEFYLPWSKSFSK